MRRVLGNRWVWLAVALALAGGFRQARESMDLSRGLRAAYFGNAEAAGAMAMQTLDATPSTAEIRRAWRGVPPPQFSVRWFGFLTVLTTDTYTLSLLSDDAAALVIDGERVLDNPGPHPASRVAEFVRLERGVHQIALEYTQYGEEYALQFDWARYGEPLTPVPEWVLAPRSYSLRNIVTAHAFDLASVSCLVFAGVLLAWILVGWLLPLMRRHAEPHMADAEIEAQPTPIWHRHKLAALAVFVALTVAHTWPLASDPAHLSRNDNADTMLNEWIVAWVGHQLPRDPAHLFDANIFVPERDTLAFSESLIVQSLMGLPLQAAGASPVLTYNLLLLAGFALSAWAMCLLIHRWTNDWFAALVAGSIFGFNAHTLTRLPHLQALHVEFLPPALLALDNLLRHPRVRQALALAGWFVLQALTSVHLFVFTGFALVAAVAVSVEQWWGRQWRAVAIALAMFTAASLAVLSPFLLPYWRASQAQDFTRSLGVVEMYSANWSDYLSTPARVHFSLWSHHFFVGTALFPGALALALSALTVWRGVAFRNARARMCLAVAAIGLVLSFGVKVPGYVLLYEWLPPLQAIRGVVRFGYLVIVGTAALAGFGVVVVKRMTAPASWPLVGSALVVVAAFESFVAPIGYRAFDGVPAIYSAIPKEPRTVVVELPFYDARSPSQHASYMLNSTVHWQPMLNGYSGFQPRSFGQHAEILRGFPDDASLELLKTRGVTYIFVHADKMSVERMETIRMHPALESVKTEGAIELFKLRTG